MSTIHNFSKLAVIRKHIFPLPDDSFIVELSGNFSPEALVQAERNESSFHRKRMHCLNVLGIVTKKQVFYQNMIMVFMIDLPANLLV